MHHLNPHRRAAVEPLESRTLLASTISGTLFNDANANGVRDSGEAPLKGQRVFVDTNFDGLWQSATEPSAISDAHGAYRFSGAAAGVYRITAIAAKGFRRTFPGGPFYDVVADGFSNFTARNFGFTNTGIIRGMVFNDLNRDGKKQSNEPALANVVVFIDKNNNGKLDGREKSRKTTANGTWRFNGLNSSPANYVIRVVAPNGKTITTPTDKFYSVKLGRGKTISHLDFGLA
jgi:hypothetical protein